MKNFSTVLVSGSLASKPATQSTSRPPFRRPGSKAIEGLRIGRVEAGAALMLPPRGNSPVLHSLQELSSSPPAIQRKITAGEKVSLGPVAMKTSQERRVRQNDLVTFANRPEVWAVVAPVNGSKADIRRNGGFDTRIVTAPLESITVVRRAGSPEYSY